MLSLKREGKEGRKGRGQMKGGRGGGGEMEREYKQEKRTLNMCIKSLLHVYVEY